MSTGVPPSSLSSISTLWTVVCQAHAGPPEAVPAAQRELLQRYGRAVHRYLLGALREAEAADELGQEFALRFLRGEFRGASPERGRFRDYVKGVLWHLIADHHRRRGRSPALPADTLEPADPTADPAALDRQFRVTWREELMARAWDALAALEERTGRPFHTVLRLRADQPGLRSADMAGQLSAGLGKPVGADWVRQTLHRAREKFVELLVHEVVQTLHRPNVELLEQELAELGLLEHCRPAVDRFRGGP